MTVGRICTREIDVVRPEESAAVAARRMLDRKVGTLVAVDDVNHPVGILTDRDLAVTIVANSRDAGTVSVADVMTPSPRTVHEETSIEEALATMRLGPCRRLPVVDDEGCLAGLLSLDDILTLLAEEFRDIGRLLNEESPSSLGRI